MLRTLTIGLALLLCGCASGYSQYYQPTSSNITIGALPPSKPPQIVAANGPMMDQVAAYLAAGYVPVGSASFNGPAEGSAGALAQARKVGAELVVVSSRYSGTVQGAIPITTTSTSTATTYGSVGNTNFNAYTTTSTPTTSYIPYAINRYDQEAVFLAPAERKGIGFYYRDLNPGEVQGLETAKAVFIIVVRKGSPAFLADVLPGDYLVDVNGSPTYDLASTRAALESSFGKIAHLSLIRGGRKLTLDVSIPPEGRW